MRPFALLFLLTAVLAFFKAPAWAAATPGYLSDVTAERNERFYEVYLFLPHMQKEPSLQEMIFNPLTKEFQTKYREAFGEMDTDSINYRSQALGGTKENPQAILQESEKRKSFAEYMTKRLLEYHVDKYMRTQPQMKPVLEVKEKIQNVKVQVTKQVRLNIQYNFAGNMADFILDNPYCESKISLEMDPHSFGPTEVQETRAWINRDLTSSLKMHTNFAANDGIAYADLTKTYVRRNIATTVGYSVPFKDSGKSVRESKYLVGFTHTF
jgi:hypothetical protein